MPTTSMSVDEVTRVAKEVVKDDARGYEVVGVTMGDFTGDYAEVLIKVIDCDHQPCMVAIGIFRDAGEKELRKQIAEKLKGRL